MKRASLVAALLLLAATALAMGPTTIRMAPYKPGARIAPFAQMPQPNYYLIDGATVAVEFGFAAGADKLLFGYEGSFALTAAFNGTNGVMTISGAAPISEYAVAIQSVVFSTTATDGNSRQITFAFGANTVFASSTQHFYNYVTQPSKSWQQAEADCASRTYMGMQGYLATITSAREHAEVCGRTTFPAWLGASSDSSSQWRWQTGPEAADDGGKGQPFWNGASIYQGGEAASWLSFDQWYRFRPDGNVSFLSTLAPMYATVAYWANKQNADYVGGWICEFGGLDAPNISSTVWDYTGSVTLFFDCASIASLDECVNYAAQGCQWNSGNCQSVDCTVNQLQAECVLDRRCGWFVNGEVGVCANQPCSVYGNNASCSLDSTCAFKVQSGSGTCQVATCADKTSACTCTALAGCSWRGQCVKSETMSCNGLDVVYLLDGTMGMMQAFERYSSGFFGLAQAFADADLGLTGTGAAAATTGRVGQRVGLIQYGGGVAVATPGAVGSGGRLTGSPSQLLSDVQWHQRMYTGSYTTRSLSAALTRALTMFGTSARTKVLVIISSGEIDDAATLAADQSTSAVLKRLQADTTIIGVALNPTEPITNDAFSATQSLNLLTRNVQEVTMTNFFTQVLYGMCDDQSTVGVVGNFRCKIYTNAGDCTTNALSCVWANGQCAVRIVPQCSLYNRSICLTDRTCSWDHAGRTCRASGCLDYCVPTVCNADPTCTYDGVSKGCFQSCPSSGQADCKDVCAWNFTSTPARCTELPCFSNPDEDSCTADPMDCLWNPATPTMCVQRPCRAIGDQATCNLATRGVQPCTWIQASAGCFENLCQTTSATVCGNFTQCMWNATASTCALTACGVYQTEMLCNSFKACTWDVSKAPGGCRAAPCKQYPTQQNCLTDAACYWQPQSVNGFGDTCAVKTCDVNLDAASCTTMSQCVWRNGACKDGTFVQCPMIDVVFLVEATPVMGRAFGRHPNGFMGIVEAIRTWSQSAPLSPSIVQSGFRLAIVGYGDAAVPLVAAADVGGNNFTANIENWAGLGKILDSVINQQPQYALRAGSNVAITEGLEKVRQLFANSSATRDKLLIILGNSPITDAASGVVNSKVGNLQGSGVQIFSNLVRRFSVITPLEQRAAEFLTPLASDPVELHFSYQTIDLMLSAMLNTFCDPTTSIGQALGINADNIVPCSWLRKPLDCQIQATCAWNATAVPSCPLPSQCPNLDCMALPAALSSFRCSQCKYEGGAFACDGSTRNPAVPGMCMAASCMLLTMSECNSNAACRFDTSARRCIRDMCRGITPQVCNTNLGCVFNGTGCVLSQCGLIRDQAGCLNYAGADGSQPCAWDLTQDPPICVEKRCQYLDSTTCAQAPYATLCTYQSRCTDRVCQYTDGLLCNEDASCYWDPFQPTPYFGLCNTRGINCVLSDFGPWSACSASCGATAVQYRTRTILVFPTGGAPCPTPLTEMQFCNGTTVDPSVTGYVWQNDCGAWCNRYSTSVTMCIRDQSCRWANASCLAKPTSGCGMLDAVACNASDMCAWSTESQFCTPSVLQCAATTSTQCNAQSGCFWRTGTNANAAAQAINLEAQIVNPGQKPVAVFGNIDMVSAMIVGGASVTIENGYQIGKDTLQMMFPDKDIVATFSTSSGVLKLVGNASVTQYANAIRSVTFQTSSLRAVTRNITWALGVNTIFSLSSGHFYSYTAARGVSWSNAVAMCQATSYFGYVGYLATITSALENQVVSNKLGADGWISGDDFKLGVWELSTGPEAGTVFWNGGNMITGGFQATGQYGNWDVLAGEPMKVSTGFNNVYLNQSGYWYTKSTDAISSGYMCEFGGLMSDVVNVNYPIGGGMVIGIGGCLPTTPCSFHATNPLCSADPQCTWTSNACVMGCGAFSTPSECGSSALCAWDTKVLPPQCDVNPCLPTLGNDQCQTNPQCVWSPTSGCTFKTGCAANLDSSTCNIFAATCTWQDGSCVTKGCDTAKPEHCAANPLCAFSPTIGCTTISCRYGDKGGCEADVQCVWSESEGSSVGFVAGGVPITPFLTGLQSPTQLTPIDGITIFISQGFQVGEDILTVNPQDNIANTFDVRWDSQNGVLRLAVTPSAGVVTAVQGFNFMKQYVRFVTSSNAQARRSVSYTLGLNAYYSPYARVFYRLNSSRVNTFKDATAVCSGSSFFGMQGTVAYITSHQDNIALNSLGASGWLGASYNGMVWSWQSLAGQSVFWKGVGSSGQPMPPTNPLYSQWSAGEPAAGSVFAVMNPSGTWKGATSPAAAFYSVVCQYNGTLTQVIAGKRALKPQGCYAQECFGLFHSACAANPNCVWMPTATGGSCQTDMWCSTTDTIVGCGNKELCYWDYRYSVCRSQAPTFCSLLNSTQCQLNLYSQCEYSPTTIPRVNSAMGGACVYAGCGAYPSQDTCSASSDCRWEQPEGRATGTCVNRVCGYVTDAACWSDVTCQWDVNAGICLRSVCIPLATSLCTSRPVPSPDNSVLCGLSNTTNTCRTLRCTTTSNTTCLADLMCLWLNGQCTDPGCRTIGSNLDACNVNGDCTFTYDPAPACIAAQCLSISTEAICLQAVGGAPQCQWVGGGCVELSFIAKNAAVQTQCTEEDNAMPPWLFALIGVIALLLVIIMWRLYLAFAKNMTFLSPAKKNIKYTHMQYAADLFEENKKGAVETNTLYQKPSLNDL